MFSNSHIKPTNNQKDPYDIRVDIPPGGGAPSLPPGDGSTPPESSNVLTTSSPFVSTTVGHQTTTFSIQTTPQPLTNSSKNQTILPENSTQNTSSTFSGQIITTSILETTTALQKELQTTPPKFNDLFTSTVSQSTTNPIFTTTPSPTPAQDSSPSITDPATIQTTYPYQATTASMISKTTALQDLLSTTPAIENNLFTTTRKKHDQTTAPLIVSDGTPNPISSAVPPSTPTPFLPEANDTNTTKNNSISILIPVSTPRPNLPGHGSNSQTILIAIIIPLFLISVAMGTYLYLRKLSKERRAQKKQYNERKGWGNARKAAKLVRKASETLSEAIIYSKRSGQSSEKNSASPNLSNQGSENFLSRISAVFSRRDDIRRLSAPHILPADTVSSVYSSGSRRNSALILPRFTGSIDGGDGRKLSGIASRFLDFVRGSPKRSSTKSPNHSPLGRSKLPPFELPPLNESSRESASGSKEKNHSLEASSQGSSSIPVNLKRVESTVPKGYIPYELLEEMIARAHDLYYEKSSEELDIKGDDKEIKKSEIRRDLMYLITRGYQLQIEDGQDPAVYYNDHQLTIDEFASQIIEFRIHTSLYEWLQGSHDSFPQTKKWIKRQMEPHMRNALEVSTFGPMKRAPVSIEVPVEMEAGESLKRMGSSSRRIDLSQSHMSVDRGGSVFGEASISRVASLESSQDVSDLKEVNSFKVTSSYSTPNQSPADAIGIITPIVREEEGSSRFSILSPSRGHSTDLSSRPARSSSPFNTRSAGNSPFSPKVEDAKSINEIEEITQESPKKDLNEAAISSPPFLGSWVDNSNAAAIDNTDTRPATTCRQRVSQCVKGVKSCSIN